jgi:hypothetical protein
MAEDKGVSPCHGRLHREDFLNTLGFIEAESRDNSDKFKGGRRVK